MVLIINVAKAVFVRLVLLTHSLLVIWLAATTKEDNRYWLLAIAILGMLGEGLITVVKNRGKEWKWFCPCFFFYLCATIPGIWVLELNRMQEYQDKSTTSAALLEEKAGFKIEMETNTLVMIMEQLFLYLMILSRWFLPRGGITRDELSQLLFLFLGIASDITELFALFEENKVRDSTNLTYAVLSIWTISLVQFTLVLTSTHSPKKVTAGAAFDTDGAIEEEQKQQNCLECMFQTEVWSIFVNFMLQDGPFLAVRLYTMISLQVLTYSIIFFTAKNGLLVMLLIYRLIVVCYSLKAKIEAEKGGKSSGPQDTKKKPIEGVENTSIAGETKQNADDKETNVIEVSDADDVEKGLVVEDM